MLRKVRTGGGVKPDSHGRSIVPFSSCRKLKNKLFFSLLFFNLFLSGFVRISSY